MIHNAALDKVPADIRLITSSNLECDEALLTGESMPVEKDANVTILLPDMPLAERHNMVYMNTTVIKGSATGIVVGTGMKTQIGKIAKSLTSAKKESTKLEKNMKILGFVLVFASVICIGLVLLGSWLHGTMPVFPDGLKSGVTTVSTI